MWVLEAPESVDIEGTLTRALTYASGIAVYQLSDAEKAAIHTVYQLYEDMLGQPHPGLSPAELAEARPHLYEAYGQVQVGGRLAGLREHLLKAVISCPYCGFGEPTDLDHYLPRQMYGELAIFPNNLVPSCGKCNNAKRKVVPGVAPAHGPGLIHPYYQALPDTIFLNANIEFANGALNATFFIDPSDIDADLAAKLQFQIDRLKLNDRYPAQINKFISEQRTAILHCREGGAEALKDYLHKCVASLAHSFHLNDWRVALLRALADTPEFCAAPDTYLGT